MYDPMEETRKDISEIKNCLASIDKKVDVAANKLDEVHTKTIKLEERVDVIDDHRKFVNSVFKIISVCGGIAMFVVEVLPFVHSLFAR